MSGTMTATMDGATRTTTAIINGCDSLPMSRTPASPLVLHLVRLIPHIPPRRPRYHLVPPSPATVLLIPAMGGSPRPYHPGL